MNWKNRLTNYNFWISMFSAILLVLQALKIEFDILYVNEIFTAVLGLLVVIGIISDPTRTSVKSVEVPTANVKEKQKVEEKIETEEPKLPTVEKNETCDVVTKNDFETILNKISLDINEKFESFKNFNQEITKTISEKQKVENQTTDVKIIADSQPAVAEMENPYINVIN